ncbi:MAG: 3'-5' exonuclease [Candidatus Hodarchaeota archaeon]
MVIDLETTSLDEWNGDIIEIAICELDLENYSYKLIYDSLVGYERVREGAWIFEHSDLTPEMIKMAYPEKNVFTIANQVRKIVKGSLVTSYNVKFDFAFLSRSPWRIKEVAEIWYCIMKAATPICDIEDDYYGTRWPKLTYAYKHIVEKTPNGSHRASIDCISASEVLLKLIENNQYTIDNGGN